MKEYNIYLNKANTRIIPRGEVRLDMRMKEEKIDIIKNLSKYDLLKLFGEYSIKFKHHDEDFLETFEIITEEILTRMTDVV